MYKHPMISVSEAQSLVSDYVPDMSLQRLTLDEVLGRICAADVRAKVTMPPRDTSAMDGYAVRLQDVQKFGAKLKVIGDVPAGFVFDGNLGEGEAIRLFTGSPIPAGADHVIIQEMTTRNGDWIHIETSSEAPQYIRPLGLDFTKGDVIIPRMTRLGAMEIALAAAGNHAEISVIAKPRISILAAGDELVRVGAAAAVGDIVNSNTPALLALIKTWGGHVSDRGLSQDDPGAVQDMFERSKGDDIIIPVGGASVGDHDHMCRVFKKMGGEMKFETVAVKPGKPTWFGVLDSKPVLGLPGNPASALVCAHLFLRGLMGLPNARNVKARVERDLAPNGPRETYLRAIMTSRNGQLYVQPCAQQDSALLTPFLTANVLLRRPPNADLLKAGDLCEVIALNTDFEGL